MIFKFKKHDTNLYNTLLLLSRNIFFYNKIGLKDNFETRIYLMFLHFSILLIIFKKKSTKFNQDLYDSLFKNIENNMRELGYGDVAVNKKMKDLNKILYDILLKLEIKQENEFIINDDLIFKYFNELKGEKKDKYLDFKQYLANFYKFCFELPLDNELRGAIKFNNYGSS